MKKILFVLCASFQFTLIGQIPSYVPTNGLMGFWPFTGNANDLSVNANNGIVNGASLTTDRFNSANCAYSFNGSNSFISTNYVGILGTNSRAVSFWAMTSQSLAIMGAVAWGDISTAGRYEAGFNYGAPGPMMDGGNGVITYNSPSPIYNNQWHHYVMQIAGSSILNQVQIFQDGVLLTSTSNSYNGTNVLNTISSFSVQFGRIPASPFHYFNGNLDDIGIWNRALTQVEINGLFNGSNIFTGMNSNITENTIEIYPNPTVHTLYLTGIQNNSAFFIYNSIGDLIKKNSDISGNTKISVDELKKGVYFIKVESLNGTYFKKFIKE